MSVGIAVTGVTGTFLGQTVTKLGTEGIIGSDNQLYNYVPDSPFSYNGLLLELTPFDTGWYTGFNDNYVSLYSHWAQVWELRCLGIL